MRDQAAEAFGQGLRDLNDEVQVLRALVRAIRDIHTPHDNTAYRHGAETSCTECAADWPCPTIQLIEEAQ